MTWVLLPAGILFVGFVAAVALWWRARQAVQRERASRLAGVARLRDLEKLAARNAAILQNAMDGFFVLGSDYHFLEVNEAFCRMTGYGADELLRMRMTDLEVAAPASEAAGADQWRTGLHHFATAHRHKDGHIIQLESCVIVLRDGKQKILAGFARDVTERWQAEQALRKSESQYRNLVETSRDLIWSMDLDGRWTFVNRAAADIYGYEPEEMLGRRVTEFLPSERVGAGQKFLDEVRAGTPRLQFETEHLRKDGKRVLLSVNAILLRDDFGNVVGCTGTAADVTERNEAERRLREAHERFESLVTGMPLGYIVWSKSFRVVDWNPAAVTIFGYTPKQAVGQRAVDLIVPEEAQAAFSRMCRTLLDGETRGAAVLVNTRKSGEKIKCEWFNTVLRDTQGNVQGIATLVRDVSEREQLEAQLRQSQRLESLGVLAGGVAHDFNNLLVGIMGNASLASEKLPDNSSVRPLLDKVVSAGRRATHLTQRMLAYAGRAAFDVQIMDLNALVEEMADFASAAIPKSVSLKIDTQSDLPLVKADTSQLQQVIMNLLINAAEAIENGDGEVSVSTRVELLDEARIATQFAEQNLKPGPYVCLEVRDNGSGMTQETMNRIFDPFFTTKFAGRGLGLSAMLGIVRAHKGAVSVESEVGDGTVFRVYLPAAGRPADAARPQESPVSLPRGSTVLVIDDEEDIREVVEAVLESRGVRVLTAEDGERGLEVFKQRSREIDAVLLDMNMPGMSGEAVYRELMATRPDVKVVLSTGYSEQEATAQFANASLAGFVHKPYTATALVEKIGAVLTGD
jgi:PAS domain S-box-containing protein